MSVVAQAAGLFARHLRGDVKVDPWGSEPAFVDLVVGVTAPVARVTVGGPGTLPASGPALLVANRRLGIAEPLALLRAVHQATHRHARFLGLPDVAPMGPILRRVGGAIDRPEELAGLLRDNNVVMVFLGRTFGRPPRAGGLDAQRVAPALRLGVPVIPIAVYGGDLTGHWRVMVGEPVEPPVGRSPLALSELAQRARAGVQELLDEASPPMWLMG